MNFYNLVLCFSALSAFAAGSYVAKPSAEYLELQESLGALPANGTWEGQLLVHPTIRNKNCSMCQPIPVPSVAIWYSTSVSDYLILRLGRVVSSPTCAVANQTVIVKNVAAVPSENNYFQGNLFFSDTSAGLPVCFYWSSGAFAINISQSGSPATCPGLAPRPICTTQAGNISEQVWSGHFANQPSIAGHFSGKVSLMPYNVSSSGDYTCLTCTAYVDANLTIVGNEQAVDHLNLTVYGDDGTCLFNGLNLTIISVVPVGESAPSYYKGIGTWEGEQTPLCFFFDGRLFLGALNAEGSCPFTGSRPECTEGDVAGTINESFLGEFFKL